MIMDERVGDSGEQLTSEILLCDRRTNDLQPQFLVHPYYFFYRGLGSVCIQLLKDLFNRPCWIYREQ